MEWPCFQTGRSGGWRLTKRLLARAAADGPVRSGGPVPGCLEEQKRFQRDDDRGEDRGDDRGQPVVFQASPLRRGARWA